MGAKMFTGVWSVAQCSQYCDAQTKYNLATAPKDGTPAKVCKFFNTYLLTAKMANGKIVPQGQYCSLYTEAWPVKYATNAGQWRGQDQYTVDYSFGYSKVASSSDIDPLVGDSKGATYQAVADIKWSKLQPFCSSYLSYTTPASIQTIATSTTAVVFSTVFSTTTTTVAMAKRALTTPADLQKYQPSVISAACSMQATPYTSTTTATVTASTSTSIIPVVVTATASPIPVNAPTCDIAVARFGSYNRGGCVYCYCNAGTDGIARCVDDMSSGTYCTANADCPAGEFCDIGDIKNPGRGYCSSGKSCSSTFGSGVSPRDLPAVA
ncbi:hypothetical protein E4T44_14797, partial [Aureobasidium sp. EXF-8845]